MVRAVNTSTYIVIYVKQLFGFVWYNTVSNMVPKYCINCTYCFRAWVGNQLLSSMYCWFYPSIFFLREYYSEQRQNQFYQGKRIFYFKFHLGEMGFERKSEPKKCKWSVALKTRLWTWKRFLILIVLCGLIFVSK